MGIHHRLVSATVWCFMIFTETVNSQGYYFKQSNVNAYQLVNGKFQYIPSTTPHPSLLETIFPWTGNAYDSMNPPEVDAAIIHSLSDNDIISPNGSPPAEGDGILSWFTIPSFTMPSFQSDSSTGEKSPEQESQYHGGIGGQSNAASPSSSILNMNFLPDISLLGSSSQVQPVAVPAPGPDNQAPYKSPQQSAPQQYQITPPNYIPHDIRNNVNPTFQFHQQVKDAIPIPSPSISGLSQPMIPYPYSAPSSTDFMKTSPERTASFLDMLSNYFTFGKRSDIVAAISEQGDQIDSRNGDDGGDSIEKQWSGITGILPIDDAATFDFEATREALDGKTEFLCPKSGIWRWNGEVCIAVGPIPVWACKPNDLIVSGKIAICRNKIYFSPKVINHHDFHDLKA